MNVSKISTLSKMIPTTKHFKVIDQSDNMLRILILNKFEIVQYSDTCSVEEEWLI